MADEVRAGREAFFTALDDDFDPPGALAVLFSLVRSLNRHEPGLGSDVRDFLLEVDALFDAFDLRIAREVDDAHIDELVRLR